MFAYTQSKGGVRRGNIQQSGGKISLPAYDQKYGLSMNARIYTKSLDGVSRNYQPTGYCKIKGKQLNKQVDENGLGYSIFKIDDFMSSNDFYFDTFEDNMYKAFPSTYAVNQIGCKDREFASNYTLGFAFRLYGYEILRHEKSDFVPNVLDPNKTTEYMKNLYEETKNMLPVFNFNDFKKSSGIITTDLSTISPGENPKYYIPQNANFSSLNEVFKDQHLDGVKIVSEDYAVYGDYGFLSNYQMDIYQGMDFSEREGFGAFSDLDTPKFHKILISLPILGKDGKIYKYKPKIEYNVLKSTVYYTPSNQKEEINIPELHIIGHDNVDMYMTYNIQNEIKKIPINFTLASIYTSGIPGSDSIKYGYSFNGYIEPFVNKTS